MARAPGLGSPQRKERKAPRCLRFGFGLTVPLALAVAAACDDGALTNDLGVQVDGGSSRPSQDGRAPERDAEVVTSIMRIAHLAPDLGPVDFCYRAARTSTFLGPVLGSSSAADLDGGTDGGDADASEDLALPADAATDADAGSGELPSATYGTVSRYLSLAAVGPITIAVVAGGSRSCANALAARDVTLDPGKLSTVALIGRHEDAGSDLDLIAFTDDRSTRQKELRARVIHAAVGNAKAPAAGPLAVRVVSSKTTVLTDRVEPRRAATPSDVVTVDALGYVTAPPVAPPATIAIVATASADGGQDSGTYSWTSEPLDLGLHGGSLHTAFVVTGEAPGTFEVLWCADATVAGDQTACVRVR